MSRLPRLICCLAVLLTFPLLPATPVAAQSRPVQRTAEDPPIGYPLLVWSVASVEKSISDIGWMFKSIQREDMLDVLAGYLNVAGDLKGVDRKRPFGYVLFLITESLPPRPELVMYVPIENLQDALKTVSLSPFKPRPVEGRDDFYEGYVGEGDKPQMFIRIMGDYAFIAGNNPMAEELLWNLPDMRRIFEPLAARYDASLALRIKAVPEGVRTVFTTFLRTQAEIELQRKDNEPEASYLIRRANGLSVAEFLDQLIMQGEDITIGWNAQPDQHRGVFELTLNATPDSEFAKFLRDVAGKPSMFTPLRDEAAPLTVNISWSMNKREIKAGKLVLDAMRSELARELPEAAIEGGALDQVFKPLHATFDAGHFDFFLQFTPVDVKKFAILGGFRLVGGQTFGTGFSQLVDHIAIKAQKDLEAAGVGAREAVKIQARADSHQGVVLHRLTTPEADGDSTRLFGSPPEVNMGASSRALWFSIGGPEAVSKLKNAMDTVLASPPVTREPGGNLPVQVTFRVAPWLELPINRQEFNPNLESYNSPTEEERQKLIEREKERIVRVNARQENRRAMANEAFKSTDSIRIEARPSENGLRTRIILDEGFVRMLGLLLANEYDRSQL